MFVTGLFCQRHCSHDSPADVVFSHFPRCSVPLCLPFLFFVCCLARCMCICICICVCVGVSVSVSVSVSVLCRCCCFAADVSLLVCRFLFSEVKFLDLLEDEPPQNHLPRMLSVITNEGRLIVYVHRDLESVCDTHTTKHTTQHTTPHNTAQHHTHTHHTPHTQHRATLLLATTTRNTTLNRFFYTGHDTHHTCP